MDSQTHDPDSPSITPPNIPYAQPAPTPLTLTPADGTTYTTLELTTLFTSLVTRLTGYAESLLGVAACLDSLQAQIEALQRQQGDQSSEGSGVEKEDEARHAVSPEEWGDGGERESGETVKRLEVQEPEWRDEGDWEDRDDRERPEGGGDGEVNSGGLGNLVSGFDVFGDDNDEGGKP